jgi:hypothetical protein
MQEEVIYFGKKEKFSIELGYAKKPNKYFLRFWIKELPMGTFKKAGTLDFSINTYKSILLKKDSMFLPEFENKTGEEINNYTRGNPNKKEFAQRLEKLVPLYKLAFFGPQFTDTQSEYLILYRDETLRFIWKNDFNQPLYESSVPFVEFCKVFDEYIKYCHDHSLA